MNIYALSTPEDRPTRISSRRFRKHLLRVGNWIHPNDPTQKLKITRDVLAAIKANFDAGRRDRVPVQADHATDWRGTRGDVLALDLDDDGLHAIMDTDEETAEAIESRKVTGVSAGLAEAYVDRETGESVGPTLLHVALTNAPYIHGLRSFEPVHLSAGIFLVPLVEEASAALSEGGSSGSSLSDDELREWGRKLDEAVEADLEALADVRLRNPDLTEAELMEVARLAALAAERLPARHPVGTSAWDGADPEDEAARLSALRTLSPEEELHRMTIERSIRMKFPQATEEEIDAIARYTHRAEERR